MEIVTADLRWDTTACYYLRCQFATIYYRDLKITFSHQRNLDNVSILGTSKAFRVTTLLWVNGKNFHELETGQDQIHRCMQQSAVMASAPVSRPMN